MRRGEVIAGIFRERGEFLSDHFVRPAVEDALGGDVPGGDARSEERRVGKEC
jgi:hypothetical protein